MLQGFFARLLERRFFKAADPHRGRFRTFLLTSLKHFRADERDKARAQKRGGGVMFLSLDDETAEGRYQLEPADIAAPDRLYDRRWAMTLLQTVLDRLEQECAAAGKQRLFDALHACLLGESDGTTYAEIAGHLAMTEGAVKVAAHRLRQQFRERLREAIADTVASPADSEDELQHLFAALRS